MGNVLLIEKPWWKRNLIWLFVIVIIISIVTTCSSLFSKGNIEFYLLANADPSFYKVALDSANNNQAVINKFGHLKPISSQEIYEGKAFYSNNKNSLNIILPVTGVKKNAVMNLWLERHSEGWKYDSIVIKNNNTEIRVIKTKSSNH